MDQRVVDFGRVEEVHDGGEHSHGADDGHGDVPRDDAPIEQVGKAQEQRHLTHLTEATAGQSDG